MNTVVIGIGSNINPQENIKKVREFLSRQYAVIKESRFLTTKPIGTLNQADFINGVVMLETELEYEKLREALKEFEKTLGRKRERDSFGPRTIDLDILVWNERIVDDDFYTYQFLRDLVLEVLPELEYQRKSVT